MSKNLGKKIRSLRKENEMLLRDIAPLLEIDAAQLSKIELGIRVAKKETILKLAEIFKVRQDELLTLWLADQVYDIVKNEKHALKAISVAENQLKYLNIKN